MQSIVWSHRPSSTQDTPLYPNKQPLISTQRYSTTVTRAMLRPDFQEPNVWPSMDKRAGMDQTFPANVSRPKRKKDMQRQTSITFRVLFDEPIPARSCGQPPDPAHGWHAGESYTFGGKVTYHCGEGYELVGRAERYCQADGSWTPKELPTCVRK